jgi:hypothetical protein
VVRADSALDLVGLVFYLADTSRVPPRGPFRTWLRALSTELSDTAFALARAIGPTPVNLILETWDGGERPDSACGTLLDGGRLCVSGNAPIKAAVRRFIGAALAFAPRSAPALIEGLDAEARRRDLSDVYVALTRSRALDSAVIAYTGYQDLSFEVVLARTFPTALHSPAVDAAEPRGPDWRIYLAPDPVFPARSYRSPNYVWLALGHQMAHAAVRRLFAERPELVSGTLGLLAAVQPEMARSGYASLFWEEALAEQLVRAITVRVMARASPTVTWAARSEGLNANMALVPWLEDALVRYEEGREGGEKGERGEKGEEGEGGERGEGGGYRTLSDFAGELAEALRGVPLDSCRAAPSPGVGLVGVAKSRAVVAWLARESPFRERGLMVGDTVLVIDEDSVSGGGLLLPTRQLHLAWAQHLPFELGMLTIRRGGGGREYGINVPIGWRRVAAVRVASQSRQAAGGAAGAGAAGGAGGAGGAAAEPPICRWVTRAVRG